MEGTIYGKVFDHSFLVRPVANGKTGKIGCPHRSGFNTARPIDRSTDDISLRLHEKIICAGTAIDLQCGQRNTGVCLHGIKYIVDLVSQ